MNAEEMRERYNIALPPVEARKAIWAAAIAGNEDRLMDALEAAGLCLSRTRLFIVAASELKRLEKIAAGYDALAGKVFEFDSQLQLLEKANPQTMTEIDLILKRRGEIQLQRSVAYTQQEAARIAAVCCIGINQRFAPFSQLEERLYAANNDIPESVAAELVKLDVNRFHCAPWSGVVTREVLPRKVSVRRSKLVKE